MNIGSFYIGPGPIFFWSALALLWSNPAENGMIVVEAIMFVAGLALMVFGLA